MVTGCVEAQHVETCRVDTSQKELLDEVQTVWRVHASEGASAAGAGAMTR